MLNFPPKSGIKLNDIDIINQKDGILKIEFASDKILLFPQTNFSRSTKKNPIWVSPFRPELFYPKNIDKLEKKVWTFKGDPSYFKNLVI